MGSHSCRAPRPFCDPIMTPARGHGAGRGPGMTVKRDLNDAWLRVQRPPAEGRMVAQDTRVAGLVWRLTRAGTASWSFRTRTRDGRQVRVTVGTWPAVGLGEARRRALVELGKVQGGQDVTAAKRASRAAREAQEA